MKSPTNRPELKFMVRSLNKDGSLSRAPLTHVDWQLNASPILEAAEARVRYLVEKNPNKRFVIIELEPS